MWQIQSYDKCDMPAFSWVSRNSVETEIFWCYQASYKYENMLPVNRGMSKWWKSKSNIVILNNSSVKWSLSIHIHYNLSPTVHLKCHFWQVKKITSPQNPPPIAAHAKLISARQNRGEKTWIDSPSETDQQMVLKLWQK